MTDYHLLVSLGSITLLISKWTPIPIKKRKSRGAQSVNKWLALSRASIREGCWNASAYSTGQDSGWASSEADEPSKTLVPRHPEQGIFPCRKSNTSAVNTYYPVGKEGKKEIPSTCSGILWKSIGLPCIQTTQPWMKTSWMTLITFVGKHHPGARKDSLRDRERGSTLRNWSAYLIAACRSKRYTLTSHQKLSFGS